jgi:hypothetical protein
MARKNLSLSDVSDFEQLLFYYEQTDEKYVVLQNVNSE